MGDRTATGSGWTRRDFLRTAAAAAIPIVAGCAPRQVFAEAAGTPAAPLPKPLVVDAVDASWLGADGAPVPSVVEKILEKGLARVTGKSSVDDAIRELLSPTETVLIKFNQISKNYHRCNAVLLDALAKLLQGAGHPKEKILVVEAEGATWKNPVALDYPGAEGFTKFEEAVEWETGRTRLTRLVTKQVDAIINVGDLKDHNVFGYSGAMKNLSHALTLMQGPHHFHPESKPAPQGFPCEACKDPDAGKEIRNGNPEKDYPTFIPGIFRSKHLAGKARLHIVNALFAVLDGGPTPRNAADQFRHDGLLLSRNAVALDLVGLDIVQAARKAKGKPSLFRRRFKPTYVSEAGKAGLGPAELALVEKVTA